MQANQALGVTLQLLFIEGLLPGTEYSFQVAAMNEAGRSNFTEGVRFATTANGECFRKVQNNCCSVECVVSWDADSLS